MRRSGAARGACGVQIGCHFGLRREGQYANIRSYEDAMIAYGRRVELCASIDSQRQAPGNAERQALGDRRGWARFPIAARLSVFAAHDFEPAGGGGLSVYRRQRERLAHERLDAHAAGAGEVAQQAMLGEREPHADSSHIRILNIAERMQSALRGQAQSGRTHGPGHTRLPCF